MYEKNLKQDLRLRLSEVDMEFLKGLAEQRACSVSEVIRSILGDYRRSIEMMDTLKKAMILAEKEKGVAVHGDTKTDFNDKL